MVILVGLVATFGVTQALAWGESGHRVVGAIAWHHLEPQAKKEVLALLSVAGEESFAESTTWADRIRGREEYKWAAPLHYISLPRNWSGYNAGRDCPVRGCILAAIDRFTGTLADCSATGAARAEALLFVAHFVGDLHQPLHTGLAADRGGNDVQVEFFGFDTNLHAVWDIFLPAGFITDWKLYAAAQSAAIQPAQVALWQHTSPLQWASESHHLVHTRAYTGNRALGEDYYLRNRPVVEQRLRQAGVRLAGLLNRALASKQTGRLPRGLPPYCESGS